MAEHLCFAHHYISNLQFRNAIQSALTDRVHVLALTACQKAKDLEQHIENFSLYSKNRNSNGHHAFFYIRSDMTVIQRNDLDHKDLEMIWVEIYLPDPRPVLVGCCYRSSKSKIDYLHKICRKIEMVSSEDKDIFLLGNFNINSMNNSEKKMIDFVFSVCGLTQIINECTPETQSTPTCTHHIYTNIRPAIPPIAKVSDPMLITVTVQRSVPTGRNTEIDPLSDRLKSLFVHSEVSEDNITENENPLRFETVDKEEVKRLLSLVDSYLLQTTAPSISVVICDILNCCIRRGEFPSERHESSVFRPDLHPILEKVLLQQMEKHFNTYELFTHQHTLDYIINQWVTHLDKNQSITDENNKNQVGVVFMDFSFSSDIISPDLLIHKLKSYSFAPLAISMMRSFLSHRNSSSCHWTDTHCELPRGSCMTHFLLSVYTNTLKCPYVVVSGSQLMIYHAAENYEDLKRELTDKSDHVRRWLRGNRMVLKTFTSTVIKKKQHLEEIQIRLQSTLTVNVEEFNWIRVLRVLLHKTPHWVWTS